ncbi:unnamed protein product [Ixodes hexagonus]
MAALCGDFELWLADKLRTLNIDPDVFGSYITGILEGTETEEEKSEALQGILTEVCEDGISEVKDEIFDKWSIYTQSPAEDVRVDDEGRYNVEAKLVSLMEEQAKSVIPEKSVTVEEQKLRQAILAQYAEVSDGEEESGPVPKAAAAPETVTAAASTGAPHKEHYAPKLLARNTNAETVAHAEKEKRELSKQEHERKKAQDKLNREKQKQQQQDRKEKERKRTQKGERRR